MGLPVLTFEAESEAGKASNAQNRILKGCNVFEHSFSLLGRATRRRRMRARPKDYKMCLSMT